MTRQTSVQRYDVIVIGTGFGGSVMARNLSAAGARVAVLERGKRIAPDELKHVFEAGDPSAHSIFDLRRFDQVSTLSASAVGGGSLIFGNVFVPPPAYVFKKWPADLTYDELRPYLAQTGQLIPTELIPHDQRSARSRFMSESADAIGYGDRYRPLELTIKFGQYYPVDNPELLPDDWRLTGEVFPGGGRLGECIHRGDCTLACPYHAKRTLDVTCLAEAERFGASIRPLHRALDISPTRRGYRVTYDEHTGGRTQRGTLEADRVVVAAGSIGSTELLLRCREHGSLPRLSSELGRHWSANGYFAVPAFLSKDTVHPSVGPHITGVLDFMDGVEGGQHFWLEDGGFPRSLFDYWTQWLSQAPQGDTSYLSTSARSTVEALVERAHLGKYGGHKLVDNLMLWTAQGLDPSNGILSLLNGAVRLEWDVSGCYPLLDAIVSVIKRLCEPFDPDIVLPFAASPPRHMLTSEPLGGCRMAADLTEGVVDHAGEVFCYPGLYVADGAIIPGALGCPPSRTIAAIAARSADLLVENDGRNRATKTGTPITLNHPITGPIVRFEEASEQVCHIRATVDAQVLLHHTTTIELTVSGDEFGFFNSSDSIAADESVHVDPNATLTIQVVPRMNFRLTDNTGDRRTIPVPEYGHGITLYFDVRAESVGEGELWIVVRQHQMIIARLVLSPTVCERAQLNSAKTSAESRVTSPQAVSAPVDQLLIIEQLIGNEVCYLFEVEMPTINAFGLYTSAPIKGAREQFVARMYREIEQRYLNAVDFDTARQDTEAFHAELQAYGALLFEELFPRGLQEVLWRHRHDLKSVRVVSTEPFIPWEIVHLKEPDQPLASGAPSKFLGQMGLVRWLHNVNGLPPTKLRARKGRVVYVIPDYPDSSHALPSTEGERGFLERAFGARGIPAQPNDVREVLVAASGIDVLHFACHAEADIDSSTHSRIVLQGRIEGSRFVPTYLNAATVAMFARVDRSSGEQPLVFLNACQSGRSGYALTGTGGFAQAFLRAGAGAFIGTLWSVGDNSAGTFAEAFYSALCSGETVSEATTQAREVARAHGDATWLSYAVYAHPHARLLTT